MKRVLLGSAVAAGTPAVGRLGSLRARLVLFEKARIRPGPFSPFDRRDS